MKDDQGRLVVLGAIEGHCADVGQATLVDV